MAALSLGLMGVRAKPISAAISRALLRRPFQIYWHRLLATVVLAAIAIVAGGCSIFPLSEDDENGLPGLRELAIQPGKMSEARHYMRAHRIKMIPISGSVLIKGKWYETLYIQISPFKPREVLDPLRQQSFIFRIQMARGALDSTETVDATLKRSRLFPPNLATGDEYTSNGKRVIETWVANWRKQHPRVILSQPVTTEGPCRYTFQFTGPSGSLSERKSGYWEQLSFYLLLYPPWHGNPEDVTASFEVKGKIVKWPESDQPADEQFHDDPFPKLGKFVNQLKDEFEQQYGQ